MSPSGGKSIAGKEFSCTWQLLWRSKDACWHWQPLWRPIWRPFGVHLASIWCPFGIHLASWRPRIAALRPWQVQQARQAGPKGGNRPEMQAPV